MELVEGDDLSQRIARGAIPLDEALPIAKQIAEALEAAHEQGIIHRDLKPANIKVRPDGTVKVLDFGLAKAMEPAGIASPSVSHSPTITTPAMTQAGMILGTAAYMAPEQARGKPVDKRADIWAFGCVLFEMLTGKRAFDGRGYHRPIVSVVSMEPDWRRCRPTCRRVRTSAPALSEQGSQAAVRDIGDARLALDGAFERLLRRRRRPERRRQADSWLDGRLAVAVVYRRDGGSHGAAFSRDAAGPPLRSLQRVAASEVDLHFLMLSPDGRHLAFISVEGGPSRIWVRPLDSLDAGPSRTDGAVPILVAGRPEPGILRPGQAQDDRRGGRPGTDPVRCADAARRHVESRWRDCLRAERRWRPVPRGGGWRRPSSGH